MIPKIKVERIDRMTLSEIEAKGLQHLLTLKKKIKRQPGRPRVIPDRRFQFSMSYWYGLIAADYHQLSKIQRVRVALECWKALLTRMKSIPSNPEESKLNADEAMRMLGKLEGNIREGSEGDLVALQRKGTEAASQLEPALVAAEQPYLNASQSLDQTKVDTSGQGSDGENLHA